MVRGRPQVVVGDTDGIRTWLAMGVYGAEFLGWNLRFPLNPIWIAALAFLALGNASGYWMILVALFFAGVGSAVQHPLASTIISHAYPDEGRRGALGTYNFFGDVGKFAFGGAVSLCLLAGISWQVPVSAFGVIGIATAVAIFFFVANSGSPHAPQRDHVVELVDDARVTPVPLREGLTPKTEGT